MPSTAIPIRTMRLQYDQLDTHLTGRMRAAYLVAGDEPLLVLEAADSIRKAARAGGAQERLVFDVAAGFDWAAWRMDTRSLGLFSSRRLIELRLSSPKIGAEGTAVVTEFVGDPGDDILLVQVAEWGKAVETLSWVSSIDSSGVIVPIWPLRSNEQPRWIEARARTLGVELTADAQLELVALVEGNLLAAHQELFKLALLAPGQRIDAMQLVDLVADSTRFDVFGLFDAVIAGRPQRVRRILAALRSEGVEPAALCGFLFGQVGALAGADEVRANGGRLQTYWPTRGVFGQRQAQLERALGRDWGARLREAAQVDLSCKGRGAGLPWIEIERWLLRASLPRNAATSFAA